MAARVFAAVDIGASGGRVIAGVVDADRPRPTVTLHTVHRFANGMHEADGHLRWDIGGLYVRGPPRPADARPASSRASSRSASTPGRSTTPCSMRTAACSPTRSPIATPAPTRRSGGSTSSSVPTSSTRSTGCSTSRSPRCTSSTPSDAARSGSAPRTRPAAPRPARLLAHGHDAHRVHERIDHRARRRPPPASGATRCSIGSASRPRCSHRSSNPARSGASSRPTSRPISGSTCPPPCVTTVGSHDTASAVVGVPASGADFAYVASGTWSLVGLELDEPVITAASRAANFTNEAGVGGRTRFLRNVGGLWLLQESMRAWARRRASSTTSPDCSTTPRRCRPEARPSTSTIRRSSRPATCRGASATRAGPAGEGRLDTPAAITACIVESLAAGYARTVAAGSTARRTPRRHDPHRRRRGPEPAALSTDRHVVGCPGRRRPGRGDGARQRVRPGDGGRRAARRPRRGPAPHRPESRPGSRSGRLRTR